MNGLSPTVNFIVGAWQNEVWWIVKAGGALKESRKVPRMPDDVTVLASEVFCYARQGSLQMKLCETVAALRTAMHSFRGTLKFDAEKMKELAFEDVCSAVKNFSRTEFESFMAAAELAVKRKKPSEVEQVAQWLSTRLQAFMNAQWTAAAALFTMGSSKIDNIADHRKIPAWFWDLQASVWSSVGQKYIGASLCQ